MDSHRNKRVLHFANPDGSEVARDAVTLVGGHTVGMIPASSISFSRNVELAKQGRSAEPRRESAALGPWLEDRASATSTHFGAAGAGASCGTRLWLLDGVAGHAHDQQPATRFADTLNLGFAGRSGPERGPGRPGVGHQGLHESGSSGRMEIDAPGQGGPSCEADRYRDRNDEVFLFGRRSRAQVWVVVKPDTREQWRVILPVRFALVAIHGGLLTESPGTNSVPSVGAIDDPRPPA